MFTVTAWQVIGGKMSYIDALYKKDEDKIYVVERDAKKGRIFTEYDARYVFYYPDARGKHRGMIKRPYAVRLRQPRVR